MRTGTCREKRIDTRRQEKLTHKSNQQQTTTIKPWIMLSTKESAHLGHTLDGTRVKCPTARKDRLKPRKRCHQLIFIMTPGDQNLPAGTMEAERYQYGFLLIPSALVRKRFELTAENKSEVHLHQSQSGSTSAHQLLRQAKADQSQGSQKLIHCLWVISPW